MNEMFAYEFMQNALIAGIIVSLLSGIIGSLIVVNRMVFLAGGIAHAAYGGVGLAIFLGIPVLLGASIFSVFCALLISYFGLKNKENTDSIIGLIWAFGMAFGIMLVDLTPGYQGDLMSYLFGSILSVATYDLYFMGFLLALTIFTVGYFYQEFLAISYDAEFAHLRKINSNIFWVILLIFAALCIVASIRVVGLIMVIALLTIPTYIAYRFASSLMSMMILSGILSSCFTFVGLIFSYHFDISSGASIIFSATIGLFLSYFLKKR
jgi:zinc transport system permease protein